MVGRGLVVLCVLLAGCTSSEPEKAAPAGPAITYEVFPPTAQFGNPPRAVLRNRGGVPLEHDDGYLIERLHHGTWRALSTFSERHSCAPSSFGLVLHPGEQHSQQVLVCDQYGQPWALPPGLYRVAKTALTIPRTESEDAEEIAEVAEFRIAEPDGPVPAPGDCEVLCVSDTEVERGDVVEVSFTPPRRFTWGVPSEIHAGTERTIWPVAWLIGWDDDEELETRFPDEGVGWEDIGFKGAASWRWEVPERLTPGIYSIAKEGHAGSVRIPIEERITTWTVSFEVTG